MTVTITRAHRDARYEELLTDLTAVRDGDLELGQGAGEQGRRLRRRFEPELGLRGQLDRNNAGPRGRVETELQAARFASVLGVLQDRAEHAAGRRAVEEPGVAQRACEVLAACDDARRQLVAQPAGARA